MEFTFDAYKKLVITALNEGYSICSYENVDEYKKVIILRHDVDISPYKALELAEIEYEIGVQSTYFVLLSTEFYNIFSAKSSKIFAKILNMGHQIGLHFDEQKYKTSSLEQLKEYIYYEVEILTRALGTKIKVVSMHRPSKLILNKSIELDGLINTYSYKYFKKMKYISDSRMCWREDPIEVILSKKYNKVHILTHPFWYSNVKESIKEKLFRLIDSSKQKTYKNLYENFRNLDEFIDKKDIFNS